MTRRRSQAVRHGLGGLALVLALAPGAAYATVAAPQTIEVTLDKATILRMPPNAATIVIGNPIIADVTTLKNAGLIVLTGKGFGETNMIFLDGTGTAVEEANVRVTGSTGFLTVQRGMDRESYSCQPRCQPTVTLGDADTFIKGASTQITSRNTLAVPGSH